MPGAFPSGAMRGRGFPAAGTCATIRQGDAGGPEPRDPGRLVAASAIERPLGEGRMRVGVLGTLEVGEGDHHPLRITSARQRALVALLALDAGQVVSVDRLIEGLWGDDAPADARNALRHHVSRLRKTIGPSLVTRASGYLLAVQPEDVDALRFARLVTEARAGLRDGSGGAVAATLRSALALWRGAPLEEFLDPRLGATGGVTARRAPPGRGGGPLRGRSLDGAARRRGRGAPGHGR
jgi:hypothetical protein